LITPFIVMHCLFCSYCQKLLVMTLTKFHLN